MTREQLHRTLHEQPADAPRRPIRMRGSDLSDFDFSHQDLTGADFRFSNLSGANFQGSILRDANLSFAGLTDVSFVDADLTGANLNFSGLSGADLTGANLSGVSMMFSGGARNVQPPILPPEPITLTNLLQRPVWGVLIGCLLGALLVYGTSGIIYFTNQIFTTNNQDIADVNRFIVWQNLTEGVTVFLTIYFLSDWLDQRFRRIWQRHLFASAILFVAYWVINTICYFMLGKEVFERLEHQPSSTPLVDDPAPWYYYIIVALLIGNAFLYVLRQGKQLTRKMTEQEFQLLNMEKLKTRAELDALQAKINPHFLYNALNSIASLVHDNPDKAEEMTLLLSKLFRYSTGRDGSHMGSLAEELDMVRTYLQVEHVRFGDRLLFSVDTSDEQLNKLQIPQFLLQPIVENAVKHGISKRAGAGRIDVKIYSQNECLCLSVHDNGPPFPDDMGSGYGLRSIQDKLRLLYGNDARVELQNEPYKQVLLSIKLSRLQQ
ncbi:MAG: histidine kinase [Cytophagales bacterium]|nr:MAG: histidine kinase [Cytophagales bacterium]